MHMGKLLAILLVFLLAACGPAAGTISPLSSQTEIVMTVVSSTGVAGTALVGTAVAVGTSLPPGSTLPPLPTPFPATPIPTLPVGPGPTALKYKLLDQYPDFFYCDPDYYPVARANETDLAVQRFPQLQANPEEFQAILSHLGLGGATTFTDQQKLAVYQEHKRLAALLFTLADREYQFQFQVKESSGQGNIIKGYIDGAGTVTVQSRQPSIATCPICLAAHTLIATPQGLVAVENLQVGEFVWTVDSLGERKAVPILKTAQVPSAPGQPVVHLALADGRQLWASPGHPTTDGRTLGQLRLGDQLDGSEVTLAGLVPYGGPATYDILPAGPTGFYWADGVLVGSTLKNP